ncbi:protein phosphatase CheZ [Marinospirillum alkaliphilum]|uniref:Protein phosphatase CheZ n=1 Tax=Marinospirillum alkaliphilum DSM 21637 TaxID=1122209 RepID=A0A1K1VBN9_9GAMM|nr:protein phosphatase CheZ [Marinospirillum alkaliphilum]SFX22542.1 chemotaxis protein CheZ [Marinospirillum alkaliphilum DSM 21637]
MSDSSRQPENFEELLRSTTGELVSKIEQGDLADAVNLLQTINDARNRNLYQEVGRLTRALHDAIREFQLDTSAVIGDKEAISDMADATDRLNYVISLTQNAANRTMDKVEECVPIADRLGRDAASLRKEWGRLIRREMKPDEFRNLYHRMDAFLSETETHAGLLGNNFSEITLAQDYQDLTGQVVKKVITLVHEVEDSLVNLVRMASQVDRITGIRHADADKKKTEDINKQLPEGPVINAEKRGVDVVSGQDEVDDLLSSLGF